MYLIGMGASIFTGESDIAQIMVKAGLGAAGLLIVEFSLRSKCSSAFGTCSKAYLLHALRFGFSVLGKNFVQIVTFHLEGRWRRNSK